MARAVAAPQPQEARRHVPLLSGAARQQQRRMEAGAPTAERRPPGRSRPPASSLAGSPRQRRSRGNTPAPSAPTPLQRGGCYCRPRQGRPRRRGARLPASGLTRSRESNPLPSSFLRPLSAVQEDSARMAALRGEGGKPVQSSPPCSVPPAKRRGRPLLHPTGLRRKACPAPPLSALRKNQPSPCNAAPQHSVCVCAWRIPFGLTHRLPLHGRWWTHRPSFWPLSRPEKSPPPIPACYPPGFDSHQEFEDPARRFPRPHHKIIREMPTECHMQIFWIPKTAVSQSERQQGSSRQMACLPDGRGWA